MKKTFILTLSIILSSFTCLKADEGMWLLKELNKESLARMQELGFQFSPDSLYNENIPSLKDAVVIFGGGCTGVAVSEQGLLFTNHHCGYGSIQQLSSVDNDYLKNGFASQTFQEELPANGLKVSFLSKTEDITDYILKGIDENTKESDRKAQVDSLSKEYLKQFEGQEFISARVVPFYTENKYYAVVYDVFTDIRLVFAPPSSIGKFGGETDNWMWPRHTGDFSVFRVYANANNKPASYSTDNKPYVPKYHVPISIAGYDKGSYSMTIGYPGTTRRYIPSWGVEDLMDATHRPRVEVRGAKQDIWKEDMLKNDTVRIKYASKYASSSNGWKNAGGMNIGIQRLNVLDKKRNLENQFSNWVNQNVSRQEKYGNTLSLMQTGYENSKELNTVTTYFNEVFNSGIEINTLGNIYSNILKNSPNVPNIVTTLNGFYKNYEPSLDKKVAVELLSLYAQKVPSKYYPSIYDRIKDEFGNDYQTYVDWIFKNSKLINPETGLKLIENNEITTIQNDPVVEFSQSTSKMFAELRKASIEDSELVSKGTRQYMAGLLEMNVNEPLAPDANFTQRLSYGTIKGYSPADAVEYNYFTTTEGILQKEDPLNPEFFLQDYILNDLKSDNFGEYKDKDGTMHVNFTANNHTTGGNSGSPVFNGKAQLMGLNFDRNWDGLSGDIAFNPNLQRCVVVDIRYVLYVIDKIGKCGRIINELDIID